MSAPAAAGQLPRPASAGISLLAEHLVGAELLRKLAAPLVGVDRDDRARAERVQELERDVPDAADADQHGGRVGGEPWDERLDGVVGGDPGVGVRRHLHRLDARRERDQRPLVDEDVVGEAAVAGEARELVALAVHVLPAPARDAEPAAVRRVDEHRVADLRRRHVVADRVHPARVLVAEHDRRLQARRLHQPIDRVQVGRADPGAADADDHVARALRLRIRPLDELERPVVLREQRRLHAAR